MSPIDWLAKEVASKLDDNKRWAELERARGRVVELEDDVARLVWHGRFVVAHVVDMGDEVALAEDGTVWRRSFGTFGERLRWKQEKKPPQPEIETRESFDRKYGPVP